MTINEVDEQHCLLALLHVAEIKDN